MNRLSGWWAVGYDMYGKPAIAGAFASDEDAREQAKDRIPQITEIIELPTRSMPTAKRILKFRTAQDSHDLNTGMKPIRGY